jgi:hypothetical protein
MHRFCLHVRGHRGLSSPWRCLTRPHAWPRGGGPGWPWPACATATAAPRPPLPWRRCCGGPAPCRLASPSRRRLAGGCPGVAGTAPGGLGGQRERERVVAFGVTRRPCSTNSASCLCPSRRPCHPPLVFLPPSPPWTRFRAPPCLLHLTSIRCGRRVAATWSTSSTLLLSFWSRGSLQLECQSDRALLEVGTPLFLGPPSTDCPRPIGCTP